MALAGSLSALAAPPLPGISGTYVAVPKGAKLPKGALGVVGSPDEVAMTPAAQEIAKHKDLKLDPVNLCQPIGPFRMMAREDNKIEIVPSPDDITMLFQNIYIGHDRTIYMKRDHPAKIVKSWEGDSVGHWDGATLVIDTIGFNTKTWLNASAAPHSLDLHMVEKIRPLDGGKYLEYETTITDPTMVVAPATYRRYYIATKAEITEEVCKESI